MAFVGSIWHMPRLRQVKNILAFNAARMRMQKLASPMNKVTWVDESPAKPSDFKYALDTDETQVPGEFSFSGSSNVEPKGVPDFPEVEACDFITRRDQLELRAANNENAGKGNGKGRRKAGKRKASGSKGKGCRSKGKASCGKRKASGSKPKASGSKPKASGSKPKASGSKASSSKPDEASSSKPDEASSKPDEASSKPDEASRSKPDEASLSKPASESKLKASGSKPKASASKPKASAKASSSKPDEASRSKPKASRSKPEASSSKPEASGSKPEASDSKLKASHSKPSKRKACMSEANVDTVEGKVTRPSSSRIGRKSKLQRLKKMCHSRPELETPDNFEAAVVADPSPMEPAKGRKTRSKRKAWCDPVPEDADVMSVAGSGQAAAPKAKAKAKAKARASASAEASAPVAESGAEPAGSARARRTPRMLLEMEEPVGSQEEAKQSILEIINECTQGGLESAHDPNVTLQFPTASPVRLVPYWSKWHCGVKVLSNKDGVSKWRQPYYLSWDSPCMCTKIYGATQIASCLHCYWFCNTKHIWICVVPFPNKRPKPTGSWR